MVACLTAAFVFAGCKKDDDENSETQNLLPKKVTKIIEDYGDGDIYTYYFDGNGRLTKDESFYKGKLDDSDTYQYTENSIKYDGVTCSVENGRISQFVFDDGSTVKFNYSGGYLSSYLYKEIYDGETYTSELTFTYKDGNLVEVQNNEDGDLYIVKYSYGQALNNVNVDLMFLFEDIMPFTGYFGKRTKNLPSSMAGTSIENGKTKEGKTSTFTYVYDGEYITKIEETRGEKKRTYEIFY